MANQWTSFLRGSLWRESLDLYILRLRIFFLIPILVSVSIVFLWRLDHQIKKKKSIWASVYHLAYWIDVLTVRMWKYRVKDMHVFSFIFFWICRAVGNLVWVSLGESTMWGVYDSIWQSHTVFEDYWKINSKHRKCMAYPDLI